MSKLPLLICKGVTTILIPKKFCGSFPFLWFLKVEGWENVSIILKCAYYCSNLSYQVFNSMLLLKRFILLLPLFAVCSKANAEFPDGSRWSYSVGVTAGCSNDWLKNDDHFYAVDYKVTLSESYGGYHGTISCIPPLSADVRYSISKRMDIMAGITWTRIWGYVYDSYDCSLYDAEHVTSNSIYLIPSVRWNMIHATNFGLYLKLGYGLGAHFNRSDSDIMGRDFMNTHNDYLLDNGHNCIKGTVELVEGLRYKFFFYEFGIGSRFNGFGHRIGFEFKF